MRPTAAKLAESPVRRKRFEDTSFLIDRPKGTVKTWDRPDGSKKSFTYPVDYGYFPGGLLGEDDEGLDAFVGDDPQGHFESFQKLKKDEQGRDVLDETKFLVGVPTAERETIYALYGPEVWHRKVYKDFGALKADLGKFEPKKKERYTMNKKADVEDDAATQTPQGQLVPLLHGSVGGQGVFLGVRRPPGETSSGQAFSPVPQLLSQLLGGYAGWNAGEALGTRLKYPHIGSLMGALVGANLGPKVMRAGAELAAPRVHTVLEHLAGKPLPPPSPEAKEAAVQDALARFKLSALKNADIDKLLKGEVTAFKPATDAVPSEQDPNAERLARLLQAVDARTGEPGEESSNAALPHDGVLAN